MKKLIILPLILFLFHGIDVIAQSDTSSQLKKFQLIDSNGDQVIKQDEMIAFYRDKTDDKGERIQGIVIFFNLDVDKNGIITLKEYLKSSIIKNDKPKTVVKTEKDSTRKAKPKTVSAKKISPKKASPAKTSPKKENSKKIETKTLSAKQKKKEKFRRMDLDDDNRITLWEMVDFHKGRKNKKGEPVESELMFYGLDKNKDNVLTMKEFLKKVDWKLGKQRLKLIKMKRG